MVSHDATDRLVLELDSPTNDGPPMNRIHRAEFETTAWLPASEQGPNEPPTNPAAAVAPSITIICVRDMDFPFSTWNVLPKIFQPRPFPCNEKPTDCGRCALFWALGTLVISLQANPFASDDYER